MPTCQHVKSRVVSHLHFEVVSHLASRVRVDGLRDCRHDPEVEHEMLQNLRWPHLHHLRQLAHHDRGTSELHDRRGWCGRLAMFVQSISFGFVRPRPTERGGSGRVGRGGKLICVLFILSLQTIHIKIKTLTIKKEDLFQKEKGHRDWVTRTTSGRRARAGGGARVAVLSRGW